MQKSNFNSQKINEAEQRPAIMQSLAESESFSIPQAKNNTQDAYNRPDQVENTNNNINYATSYLSKLFGRLSLSGIDFSYISSFSVVEPILSDRRGDSSSREEDFEYNDFAQTPKEELGHDNIIKFYSERAEVARQLIQSSPRDITGCIQDKDVIKKLEDHLTEMSSMIDKLVQQVGQQAKTLENNNLSITRTIHDSVSSEIEGVKIEYNRRLSQLEKSDANQTKQLRDLQASAEYIRTTLQDDLQTKELAEKISDNPVLKDYVEGFFLVFINRIIIAGLVTGEKVSAVQDDIPYIASIPLVDAIISFAKWTSVNIQKITEYNTHYNLLQNINIADNVRSTIYNIGCTLASTKEIQSLLDTTPPQTSFMKNMTGLIWQNNETYAKALGKDHAKMVMQALSQQKLEHKNLSLEEVVSNAIDLDSHKITFNKYDDRQTQIKNIVDFVIKEVQHQNQQSGHGYLHKLYKSCCFLIAEEDVTDPKTTKEVAKTTQEPESIVVPDKNQASKQGAGQAHTTVNIKALSRIKYHNKDETKIDDEICEDEICGGTLGSYLKTLGTTNHELEIQ
ncbi:MAG: hypothetical protein SFT93_05140 [Rickettsiaceae bacterium]|nr:hypothetical protein [Rickettsiaceae bacterium]